MRVFAQMDGTNQWYVPAVEWGYDHWRSGKKVPGQFFMKRAGELEEPNVRKIFREVLAEEVEKMFR